MRHQCVALLCAIKNRLKRVDFSKFLYAKGWCKMSVYLTVHSFSFLLTYSSLVATLNKQ